MSSISDANMKKCKHCGCLKFILQFNINRAKKDGFSHICKECTNIKTRTYYQKHPDIIKAYRKREYIANRDRMLEKGKRWKEKTIKSWLGFFSQEMNCQVCGKSLKFISNDKKGSIHFDHRNGGLAIIKNDPKHWLRNHPRTPETERMWLSCDFGMLCESCNMRLPTNNRKEFVRNVVKYVLGKNIDL